MGYEPVACHLSWLFARVDSLLREVGIRRSLAEAGVREAEFRAALPALARAAFEDPSLRTNSRMPLVAELQALLEAAWSGDVRAPC